MLSGRSPSTNHSAVPPPRTTRLAKPVTTTASRSTTVQVNRCFRGIAPSSSRVKGRRWAVSACTRAARTHPNRASHTVCGRQVQSRSSLLRVTKPCARWLVPRHAESRSSGFDRSPIRSTPPRVSSGTRNRCRAIRGREQAFRSPLSCVCRCASCDPCQRGPRHSRPCVRRLRAVALALGLVTQMSPDGSSDRRLYKGPTPARWASRGSARALHS